MGGNRTTWGFDVPGGLRRHWGVTTTLGGYDDIGGGGKTSWLVTTTLRGYDEMGGLRRNRGVTTTVVDSDRMKAYDRKGNNEKGR